MALRSRRIECCERACCIAPAPAAGPRLRSTSAGPNDGKTLTALNLAFSMAREKSREIILLDMDMRNPSVCRTLGVQPVRQLRDYLERSSNTKDIFSRRAGEPVHRREHVPTEHASELLSSPRFDELIADLKRGTVNPIV